MSLVIGMDFDGTIVEHWYPKIGPEAGNAIEWLRKLTDAGAKIILHTCRTHDDLKQAEDFLKARGIPLSFGNPGAKPDCHVFVDDRGIGVPLIPGTRPDRMMVDWEKVGPELMRKCIAFSATSLRLFGVHVEFKNGQWVFSDLSVGLVDEPLRRGADSLLELLAEDFISDAKRDGVLLVFSAHSFAKAQLKLILDPPDNPPVFGSGNWYTADILGDRAWLCPALLRYFKEPPQKLYVAVNRI